MRTNPKNICSALFTVAMLLATQSASSPSKVIERGIPDASVSEALERSEKKRDWPVKKMFKDLRPGSCKSAARTAPGSSWPARGEGSPFTPPPMIGSPS